ncbi:hypothetical protein O181_028915 [Austropuccinia psidii MF-1]|uniref:Uncharacterized protein n=1 Tax=Austropuccinia psidii MF-1 TaxID=1389203 RepID=A0A9Q3CUA5_9BASI|nr:hypothetical protein [Austropuccinia psidii MF-1]
MNFVGKSHVVHMGGNLYIYSELIPVMSAPPTLYERIKAPPRRSVCPDLDKANLTSSPPDTIPYLNVETCRRIVGMRQAGLPF